MKEYTSKASPLEVKSEIKNSNGEIIYSKQVNVNPYTWLYDEVELQGEEILTNINTEHLRKLQKIFTY